MGEIQNAPEFDRDDDGELLIDWSPSPDRMLSLSLRADGRLSYAFRWDGETAHGTAQMPSIDGAASSCEWQEEDPDFMPGTYRSACGELWAFTDGGVKENHVRFCQGCGKPVHVVERPAEPEDADGVMEVPDGR